MDIKLLFPFIKEVDKLKSVLRQTQIHSGGRRENSAEHSWHLALTVLVAEKFGPPGMDLAKALKMALLHDLVEIDAGDTIVYADQPDKHEKEYSALERIVGLLPLDLQNDLIETWLEFETGLSAEAKFVSAIDRFLPIYSNYLNQGHSWQEHGINSSRVIQKCEPIISAGMPPLWPATQELLDESISNGHLKP